MHRKSKRSINRPCIPLRTMLKEWQHGDLESHGKYSEIAFLRNDFSGQTLSDIVFDTVEFDHANLRETELLGLKVRDVRLEECDLANANWYRAFLSRVEISNCRLVGLKAIESKVRDVVFTACNCNLMQLRFASFGSVRFEDCNLKEADFQSADLSTVVFTRCDLRGSQMSGAKLAGTSFCGSNIDGLTVNQKDIAGAIVDPMQAAYLAELLGVKVKW